jgi:hypothetical protein
MKLSRRELAGALIAGTALPAPAQNPPAAAAVQDAADALRRNSEALARFELPQSTEPAFQFRA